MARISNLLDSDLGVGVELDVVWRPVSACLLHRFQQPVHARARAQRSVRLLVLLVLI
jgi:hypothetical protein